jgi:hypothetical protein
MAIYGDGKHNENMEHIDTQNFEFFVDRKVTVWIRTKHTIEAENYEVAKAHMIESFHDDLCDETFYEQEMLFDTEATLDPDKNGGEATLELYSDNEAFPITTNLETK